MRSVWLAGIFILLTMVGGSFINAATAQNVEAPAAAENDIINKQLIKRNMSDAEKKAFDNKDISDLATTKSEKPDILLDHVKEKRGFFSVSKYKELNLYNLNTQETLSVAFWADGKFIQAGLDELDQFMRDWRNDEVIDIDPNLYMLLHDLRAEVGAEVDAPIHLISGHRSKTTNDKLRAMGRKTAKTSQHVLGRAADITIPGVPLKKLRKAALKMKRGGVGYYPKSGFVHVDTGRVRQW